LTQARIQQGTHDSLEDCKHTLALAKFKIEVLGPLESESDLNSYSMLQELKSVFDSTQIIVSSSERYMRNNK
jgi:hypothetical protein